MVRTVVSFDVVGGVAVVVAVAVVVVLVVVVLVVVVIAVLPRRCRLDQHSAQNLPGKCKL